MVKPSRQLCRLCGGDCFNKDKSTSYCKGCADIAGWLSTVKANTKIALKKKYPKQKVTFRLIIDKIEDNFEHGN